MLNRLGKFLIKTLLIFLFLEFVTHLSFFIVGNKSISKITLQDKLINLIKELNNTAEDSFINPWEVRQNVTHPYLGFVRDYDLKKNPLPESDRDYTSLFNEYGFLGEKPLLKKTRNKLIVAILGGSVAEQFYLYERKSLAKNLQSLPYFKDKEVHILDLALGAYKQPQQLITLNYFLALGGQFDIVINIDGFNEINTPITLNRQNSINPFFPWEWRMWSRREFTDDMLLQIAKIKKIRSNKVKLSKIFNIFPLKNSYFLLTVWNSLNLYEDSSLYRTQKKLDNLLLDGKSTFQTTGPPQKYKNINELFNSLVAVWGQSSFQINALSKKNDFLYLHFLQPNQYYPYSKKLTTEEKNLGILEDQDFEKASPLEKEKFLALDPESVKDEGMKSYNYLIKAIVMKSYPLLIEAGHDLTNQGVLFSDLTMLFKSESRTIYSDICCHYNEIGNQILAAKIIESIAQNYQP